MLPLAFELARFELFELPTDGGSIFVVLAGMVGLVFVSELVTYPVLVLVPRMLALFVDVELHAPAKVDSISIDPINSRFITVSSQRIWYRNYGPSASSDGP